MIKKQIYRLFKSYYLKIKDKVEIDTWITLKSEFNNIGANSCIQQPYHIFNPKYISIGDNFRSLYNLRVEAIDKYYDQTFEPKIIIGNNVQFNSDCHIGAIDRVTIGNNVLIASKVFISDHSHGTSEKLDLDIYPERRKLISKGPVIINDSVWIGEGACVLSGVTVGKNSIIGSNSVVNKNVPPYSIVAGIPAKVIKSYFESQ